MGWLDDLFNNNNKPEDIRPVIKMRAINNNYSDRPYDWELDVDINPDFRMWEKEFRNY